MLVANVTFTAVKDDDSISIVHTLPLADEEYRPPPVYHDVPDDRYNAPEPVPTHYVPPPDPVEPTPPAPPPSTQVCKLNPLLTEQSF